MAGIIKEAKSIVPSGDMRDIDHLRRLVRETHDIDGIGGYKVGAILGLRYGLPAVVSAIREFTEKPTIYDHQKAFTDIPDLGHEFMGLLKYSGIDAVIGFPQSGPETQIAWTKAAQAAGLKVIIGGEMTHPRYKRSEGGYIWDGSLDDMYLLAAKMGVSDFVMPGNKTDRIAHYYELLKPKVQGQMSLYSPGFIAQNGSISDAARVAGDSFHPIVGRGIFKAQDMRAAAVALVASLRESG